MVDIEQIQLEILKRLKPLNPNKIILFGSYAYGQPHQDSDIDLYVITNDNFIPQTFNENIELKLKVANLIFDLQSIIPIDIITHTKPMYHKFIELNSSFAQEIIEKGKVLWAKS
ncbi:nucleotidyltransferase domain-containing protein [bacterium]|nr:nucleotidyltransferase domain-containing protein [bacterium]MBU1958473.1 nucleotidyltransferase domain-containing protein [bacterium]